VPVLKTIAPDGALYRVVWAMSKLPLNPGAPASTPLMHGAYPPPTIRVPGGV
jgi:hypothetical protein